MYNLTKVIENINSFRISEGHLLEVKKGGLYFDDNFIDERVDSYNYTFHDGSLIYLKGEETYIDNKVIKKTILIDTVLNDFALFSSDFNVKDFTLKYEFINLYNGEVVLDLGSKTMLKSSYVNSENILILNFGDKISYYNVSGDVVEMWVWYDDRDIKRIIGVYESAIIVACDNHKIVILDKVSGKVIHEYQKVLGLNIGQEYRNVIPESTDFVLDAASGKLVGLFHTYIIEILLEQKEVIYSNLTEELKRHSVSSFKRFSNNAVTNDHIFAIAHTEDNDSQGIEYDSLVALNRISKKLDWQHHFHNESVGTNTPKLEGSILYQKDINHQLYIFNKSDKEAKAVFAL
jgi:hypothetical protein